MPRINANYGQTQPYQHLDLTDYKSRPAQGGSLISRELGPLELGPDGTLPDELKEWTDHFVLSPEDPRFQTLVDGETPEGWRSTSYYKLMSAEASPIRLSQVWTVRNERASLETEIRFGGGNELLQHFLHGQVNEGRFTLESASIRLRDRNVLDHQLTGDGKVDPHLFQETGPIEGAFLDPEDPEILSFLAGGEPPAEWSVSPSKALHVDRQGRTAQRSWRLEDQRFRQLISVSDLQRPGTTQRRFRLTTQFIEQVQEGGTEVMAHGIEGFFDDATGTLVKESLQEFVEGSVQRPGTGEALSRLKGPASQSSSKLARLIALSDEEPAALADRYQELSEVFEEERTVIDFLHASVKAPEAFGEQLPVIRGVHENARLLDRDFALVVKERLPSEPLGEAWDKLRQLEEVAPQADREEVLLAFTRYQDSARRGRARPFEEVLRDFTVYGVEAVRAPGDAEAEIVFGDQEIQFGDFFLEIED